MNKNILEIYKKRRYNELLNERRANEEKIADDFVKLADDYNKKLLKKLTDDGRECDFEYYKVSYHPMSEETKKELADIDKKFKDAMDDRNRLVEEIQAQIDICETYEQQLVIYKRYGILDENGLIYDYK